LGIARRIANSMGGEIGVISQLNLGSTFWVDLPFERAFAAPLASAVTGADAQADGAKNAGLRARAKSGTLQTSPIKPATQKPAKKPAKSLDILVMEDNQINRFVLREMLTGEGHLVTEAVDGLEGVAMAQTRRFDVIFTDISMPKLDGIAATVHLRAGDGPCAQVPIIALTAHALAEDRALFLASGMNAVLNKPLDRAMLLHVLAEVTLPPQKPRKPRAKPRAKPALANSAAQSAASMPAQPQTPPILRASTLTEMKAAFGIPRVTDLFDRFLTEGDAVIGQSAGLLKLGDTSAAQAMLHSLAGAAATFGALALQAHLAQMETDLKTGQVQAALTRHTDLAQLWDQTKTEMMRQIAA
ncbi:MAG: response regulator, partial [Cypionkella sp.]